MSNPNPLFKVTFDESAIHTVFDSIEAHLKLHDEQIAELQRLLKDCCTQNDLEKLRENINSDNEKQMKDLNDALTSKIDDNMKKQAEDITEKMKEINDQMKDEMNKISNDIESKVADTVQNKIDEDSAKKAAALEEEKAKLEEEKKRLEDEKAKQEEEKKNQSQNGDKNSEGNEQNENNGESSGENKGNGEDDEDEYSHLTEEEKLQKTREELKELKKLVDENRNYIQTISNSYASVNKTEAELGPSLRRTLDATSETISCNFKRIFDLIKSLLPNTNSNQNGESSISGSSANHGQNGNNGASGNGIRGTNGLNANRYPIDGPYPPEINISDLNFVCSEIPASFNEVPQLPQIYKFQTLPESVQYLYDCFPKLQGYLRAMHDKLGEVCKKLGMDDENSNENDSTKGQSSAFDPSAYDNLVASVRKALNEMSADIDELRRSKKGMSRQDVMDIIRSMMNTHEDFNSDETAVGYVRCIACGREMRQVSGAMTEEQATRKLGYAANSLAVDRSGSGPMEKSIGQVYGNTQGDSKYMDSPRSIRPPKRKSGMSYKITSPR